MLGPRAHLEKSMQSVLSAYEVAEVLPEEGLVLNDVFRGGSVRVREHARYRQDHPGASRTSARETAWRAGRATT
jgi:hypothetical protein